MCWLIFDILEAIFLMYNYNSNIVRLAQYMLLNIRLMVLIPLTLVMLMYVFFLVTAVRFGRVPKREKARILAAMQQSTNSKCQEKAVAAELEDDGRLLRTVVRAHLETCDFTRDKVTPMILRAREQPSFTATPPTLVSIFFCDNIKVISIRWNGRK